MIALCDWCHAVIKGEAGEMFRIRVTPYARGAPRADLEWESRDLCRSCADKLSGFVTPLGPAAGESALDAVHGKP